MDQIQGAKTLGEILKRRGWTHVRLVAGTAYVPDPAKPYCEIVPAAYISRFISGHLTTWPKARDLIARALCLPVGEVFPPEEYHP